MSRNAPIPEPTPEPDRHQKRRLRAHYGFVRTPFSKYMWSTHMFDSQSQRELLAGLHMWTEVRGLALVTGPSGVGKSITLRRFVRELGEERYRLIDFTYMPSTVFGFLRSLARKLGVPMRNHATDLFDAVKAHLQGIEAESGPHPILLVDDAEGLPVAVLDTLRRLTAFDLDAEDRFSVLLSGTEYLVVTLQAPTLQPLRTRFCFAHTLRSFGFEDTRNYIAHQLGHAGGNDAALLSDAAIKAIFQASKGTPRLINQLAMQALIGAAAGGRDKIDGDFMRRLISEHPLYQGGRGA